MCAAPVKGTTEAGRRREERARLTRQRIVEAALRRFLEGGYSATTVEAIAHEAGVATPTVYQAFGTKRAILAAGLEMTITGDLEPVDVLEREWVTAARRERDPVRRLDLVVRHTTQIAARSAPLEKVTRDAAATEPAVRDLVRQDKERRYRTQEALVRLILDDRGAAGIATRPATDTFFALVNSDAYELLVGHLGWSLAEWRVWLTRLLARELLDVDVDAADI